jgi:hypothetical protein
MCVADVQAVPSSPILSSSLLCSGFYIFFKISSSKKYGYYKKFVATPGLQAVAVSDAR